jgi:dihydroneopterin aldolase/D-erythro-7,8-dihydroneopterin triphosphate epimerase
VNGDERVNRQDVLLNITLETDTSAAGQSDDIADTVNYRTMTKEVISAVESSKYFLIERLAEHVATVCLLEKRVKRVRVSVEKPGALRFARSVGVVIERSNG